MMVPAGAYVRHTDYATIADLRAQVEALCSVAMGYQNMPGYSLHPMLLDQLDRARAATETPPGRAEGYWRA